MSNLLSHAFGPGDISCVCILPGAALVLDEVIDASYSEHADKIPIRRLGHRLPTGWAYGSATLAGTIVCAQLTKGALHRVRGYYGAVSKLGEEVFKKDSQRVLMEQSADFFASAISVTQLPPVHLMWVHMSEEGQMGIARWYNVVFSDKSGVFGASNRYNEQTLQYQCTYQEELRLHRSLTIVEMQELKNRTSGFFGQYHEQETLVESLAAVAGEIARDYVVGAGIAGYLLEETREVVDRTRSGEITAINIADQGVVVFQGDRFVPGSDPQMRASAFEGAIQETLPVIASSGATILETADASLAAEGGLVSITPPGGAPVELGRLETNPHTFTLSGAAYARMIAPEARLRPELLPQTVTLRVTRSGASYAVVRSGTFPDAARASSAGAFDPTGTYNVSWSGTSFAEQYTVTGDASGYLLSGTLGPVSIRPVRGRFEEGEYRFDIAIGVGAPVRRRVRIAPSGGAARLVREAGPEALLRAAGEAFGTALSAPLRHQYPCTLPAGLKVTVVDYREDTAGAAQGDLDVDVQRPQDAAPTTCRIDAADRSAAAEVAVGEGTVRITLPANLSGSAAVEYVVADRTVHSAPLSLPGEHLTAEGIDLTLAAGVASGDLYGLSISATLGQATPIGAGSDTQVRVDQAGAALAVELSHIDRRIA